MNTAVARYEDTIATVLDMTGPDGLSYQAALAIGANMSGLRPERLDRLVRAWADEAELVIADAD